MHLTTPLARVRGTGSAKDGTRHWWAQRVTGIALVPLSVWLVASLIGLLSGDYETARVAMGNPVTASLWILFVVAAFHHGQLGLQVVIEDYVHGEGAKIVLLMLNTFFAISVAAAGALSILKLSLGG
jgi:succinate dehydrogenase / fumarate reductase membrane anchor subunit